MKQEQIKIETKDGICPVYVTTPEGLGPWSAVIIYMDAFGLRPTMFEIANRVASQSYLALLPDIFYRRGPYATLNPKEVFAGGEVREKLRPMLEATDNHKAAEDTGAFIKYLDTRADVAGLKIGTMGFCKGGGIALTVAGWYPDRVAAAASFHGGNLASDEPTSPHLYAPKIKGEIYVAGADQDKSYPPEMKLRLEKALDDAHVRYKSEIYEGKLHGWMKPDMPVYDAAAAERGWKELFALYRRALQP